MIANESEHGCVIRRGNWLLNSERMNELVDVARTRSTYCTHYRLGALQWHQMSWTRYDQQRTVPVMNGIHETVRPSWLV
jgi:hypothetical protein